MTAMTVSSIAFLISNADINILRGYIQVNKIIRHDGRQLSISGASYSIVKEFIDQIGGELDGEDGQEVNINGKA